MKIREVYIMIRVISINKQGNKIISYTCTDGKRNSDLTKEQLIEYIKRKQVSNARLQIYKGSSIVRVTEDTQRTESLGNVVESAPKTANTIMDYIASAKSRGVKSLDLTGLVVDTDSLKIVGTSRIPKTNTISDETKVDSPKPKAKTKLSREEAIKIAKENVAYNQFVGVVHNRYIIVFGGEHTTLYIIDAETENVDVLTAGKSILSSQFVCGNRVFSTSPRQTYNGSCIVVSVFDIAPDGSFKRIVEEELSNFTYKCSFSKLDENFVMGTQFGKLVVVDVKEGIVYTGEREYASGILDFSGRNDGYTILPNKVQTNRAENRTTIKFNGNIYDDEHNMRAYDHPIIINDGCYMQIKLNKSNRLAVIKFFNKNGDLVTRSNDFVHRNRE